MSDVLYTTVDEDGTVFEITPEVLERRKQASMMMAHLSGISFEQHYDPGIVTLNICRKGFLPDVPDRSLILVAWKIDDAAWVIRTTGQSRISDNDVDARPDVHSFTPDSHSWAWGIEPFLETGLEDAIRLRDRIVRLTCEFGLAIDSFEAEIKPREA